MKRYDDSGKSIFRPKKVVKVVKSCCKNLDSTDPRDQDWIERRSKKCSVNRGWCGPLVLSSKLHTFF